MRCFNYYIPLILLTTIEINNNKINIKEYLESILFKMFSKIVVFLIISIISNITAIKNTINKGIPNILYLNAVKKSKLIIALKLLVRPHPGHLMPKNLLKIQ